MSRRRRKSSSLERILWVGLMLAMAPSLAPAYVGPGVGLSALGSILAFLGSVVLLIVGFLWYPIRRLLRGRSKPGAKSDGAEPGGKQTDTES